MSISHRLFCGYFLSLEDLEVFDARTVMAIQDDTWEMFSLIIQKLETANDHRTSIYLLDRVFLQVDKEVIRRKGME